MKSYFLEKVSSIETTSASLAGLLGEGPTWVLYATDNDPIAYFHLMNGHEFDPNAIGIQVEISGRHYDEDDAVLNVLREVQEAVGGIITNDDDEVIG